ncbi:MAG: ATP-binding protein, partial [Spirochaetales bacterium]|nr:ATP-binding protein [Spirochaetales bacterium]
SSLLTFSLSDNYLALSDNGPGIPKNEINRVTEKGYVGEKWRDRNGSGMGLYIVKEISRSLSINFSIESEEGKGTNFVFRFSNSNLTEM